LFVNINEFFNFFKNGNLYFNNKSIIFDNFNIQKYEVSESGKYIYHTDNNVDIQNNTERCITFLWYLNDVCSGGETEFFNNIKISPEIGKLVLFPSTWTYPHCSRPVISNDKYIMVGWLRIKCI
jgi:predicted 2-oxoglutarate/Fe(II)-dependent dioxygenase YbiX